jgi:hypothetical protein
MQGLLTLLTFLSPFITTQNKILNNGERKYNNEEIRMIRDYLYQLANLEINDLKN